VAADAGKLAEGCAACHGKEGVSAEAEVPTIAGFSAQYIIDNMDAYRNKDRTCVEVKYPAGPKKGQTTDMCRIAKEVSDADAAALGKHYAGKKFVRAQQPFDAAKASKGKKLHERSCEKCHSEGGSLAEEDAGILAGQRQKYLEHTFKEFTDGKRVMPKKMKPKIEKLSPADVDALVHFYVSQH
jgi:sulfide dehydrogenase cytochrome subunit